MVKVWFQNTRARDRREGQQHRASPMAFKHLLPPTPPASCSTGSQKHSSPATSPAHVEVNEVVDDPEAKEDDDDDDDDDEEEEEDRKIPLDLSTKTSTPSASPPPLVINSEGTCIDFRICIEKNYKNTLDSIALILLKLKIYCILVIW